METTVPAGSVSRASTHSATSWNRAAMLPSTFRLPATCSRSVGTDTPIPMLPDLSMRMRSSGLPAPMVLKASQPSSAPGVTADRDDSIDALVRAAAAAL